MPVYLLGKQHTFPPPEGANDDGVVAVGGDLSAQRLLEAYRQGIFPWPARGAPLLWFCPDPRFALVPTETHVSRSLKRVIRQDRYTVTFDMAFDEVIKRCAEVSRPDQDGTWITGELCDGYRALHRIGHAHSVEVWRKGALVGGLYGVATGKAFAGESMFATESDASKIAFVTLLGHLVEWAFQIVDCQVHTEHLARFGARMRPRHTFLQQWRAATALHNRHPWKIQMTPRETLDVVSGTSRLS